MKKLRWFEKFTASDFDLLINAVRYLQGGAPEAGDLRARCQAMAAQLSKLQADLYPGGNK